MQIYRRTIEELITRYQLEPNLRDIYVEGLADKQLIEWFLEQKGHLNCAVYEISTVDISMNLLVGKGLSDCNRSRVIFLALTTYEIIPKSKSITCIADTDFAQVLCNEFFNCHFLLFTDYTSMDIYLFSEAVIEKFLRLVVGVSAITAQDVIKNLSQSLELLFLIRCANQALQLNMQWMSFDRCCEIQAGEIKFQENQFIERYLNKNGKISEKEKFLQKLVELRLNSISDVRNKIRGKDFIELFSLYIKNYLPRDKRVFANSEVVKSSLVGCLEVKILEQENLFKEILARVSA